MVDGFIDKRGKYIRTKEHRKNMSKIISGHWIGEKNPNFRHGKTLKINYCIDCYKKISGYRAKRCRSCNAKFLIKEKGNPNYKDGRTSLGNLIRNLSEYKDWRNKIFKQNNYKCQECGYKGGNIEIHHKRAFFIIFQEFLREYNQFSPIEDKETLVRLAMGYKPFWDLNNGKILCKDCHNLKRGKGWQTDISNSQKRN